MLKDDAIGVTGLTMGHVSPTRDRWVVGKKGNKYPNFQTLRINPDYTVLMDEVSRTTVCIVKESYMSTKDQ